MIGCRRAQRLADPAHRGPVGVRSLQEAAVAPDDLLVGVPGELGEGRVDPDQRVVVLAGVGDRERHVRGDDGAVAQHLQPPAVAVLGAGELEEHHQRPPVEVRGEPGRRRDPVGHAREREAGDPQQPALAGRPLRGGRAGAAADGVVHDHRLTRHRHPARHERQRRAGLAHPPAAEVGQPGGVAPGVDVDRQPHRLAGELDGRRVGVHDLPPFEVDDQHRRRGGVRHLREDRRGGRRARGCGFSPIHLPSLSAPWPA